MNPTAYADLHLADGSAPIDAGTDLGGAYTTNPNEDIDNYDRDTDGTWDVGADEWVSSGGPPARSYMAFPFMMLGVRE